MAASGGSGAVRSPSLGFPPPLPWTRRAARLTCAASCADPAWTGRRATSSRTGAQVRVGPARLDRSRRRPAAEVVWSDARGEKRRIPTRGHETCKKRLQLIGKHVDRQWLALHKDTTLTAGVGEEEPERRVATTARWARSTPSRSPSSRSPTRRQATRACSSRAPGAARCPSTSSRSLTAASARRCPARRRRPPLRPL